jgi:hypothetical protein
VIWGVDEGYVDVMQCGTPKCAVRWCLLWTPVMMM